MNECIYSCSRVHSSSYPSSTVSILLDGTATAGQSSPQSNADFNTTETLPPHLYELSWFRYKDAPSYTYSLNRSGSWRVSLAFENADGHVASLMILCFHVRRKRHTHSCIRLHSNLQPLIAQFTSPCVYPHVRHSNMACITNTWNRHIKLTGLGPRAGRSNSSGGPRQFL
jgi:hypothetical protein